MNLTTAKDGEVLVVHLQSPRLDASQAGSFKTQMAEFVGDGHDRIVIDLANVDFVDSSGLSALISTLKLMGAGGSLALSSASAPVESLLKLTRFDRILGIYPSPADATAALSG